MATVQVTPVAVGIRNVLIATDFSSYSSSALDFGLQLAQTFNASAYVAFVVPNDPYLLAGPDAYVAARDAARRDLEELEAEVKRSHRCIEGKCHVYLLEGEVARSILDFARQKQVDLIVMGTHGRGGLRKALLGSVAEAVFRHSPVPVLTLGPGVKATVLQHRAQEILVAADFTAASKRAVEYAAQLAQQQGAHLTLLHVLDPKKLEHTPDRAAVLRGIELRLSELLGRAGEDVHCSMRTDVGHVTQTVLEVAKELPADLIVIGVRPSSGVLDRLIIPHAYDVVCEAPCPVLTLRENQG